MARDDVYETTFDTEDPATRREVLDLLRRPIQIKVSPWRFKTKNGRVLAYGVAGQIVTLFRDVCREELGEDV